MPQVRFLPSWYFNSQPHKEADSPNSTTYNCCTISTRSLTRRLTARIWQKQKQNQHFNSQPHKEADVKAAITAPNITTISTHSLTRRLTKA